ncbi:hypothetical protein Tco_0629182 [Tanacetum coccineum]|uniref:Uncharacterized protein n=1 Tax=Tanacetum coccineum TaxID=301880 RepID=A0ABQ4WSF2_9ASTR
MHTSIKYALTVNPTIYTLCIEHFWSTIKVKTINGEAQLHALVDGKKINITESSVRIDLKLEDKEGEGSANPTDPHHTPTFIQPSLQPQKTQKPRKPKRKDTQIPQSSDPIDNVADEAIYKELGDSLVRAATTASSLEVEHDSGNINKTRSKATPNESSSLGTTSGGGPRDFDVDALNGEEVFVAGQNENVVEEEFDVAQVSVAATTVIITTKEITLAQALESLKTSKPKVKGIVFQELCKSTTTTTISSQQSQDKGKGIMIEEHVKPMKKKDQISFDEEVALKLQAEFDEEERLAREKAKKEKEANIALIETWDDIQAKIDVDYQLAERLQAKEQEELSIEEKATLFQQLLEKRRKHFAAKRAEEKRNKPPTKAQQRKIMCTYLKNMEGYKLNDLKLKGFDSIQEMFDKAFKRVNTFKDFRTELVEGKENRAGIELIQEITNKQKVEDDKEIAELKQCLEIIPDEEEVTIDAILLAVKSLSIVDWKIHKEGRKSYYQIIRVDGKSQMYMFLSQMLKSFDKGDLEDLYKLVKAKYKSTKTVEDLDLGRIVGIKSLLDAVRITDAQVYVNTAPMNGINIFTKALCRERIEFLIDKLGMRSFTPETLKELADEAEE